MRYMNYLNFMQTLFATQKLSIMRIRGHTYVPIHKDQG